MIDDPGANGGKTAAQKAKWSWGEKPPQLFTLCALSFLVVPVGLLAPGRLPLLLTLVGGLTLLTNPVSGFGPIKRQAYLYPLAALLVLAGFSLLWSAGETKPALDGFLKLTGLSAFGVLLATYARELREEDKRLLGRWLVPAFWAFCALFLFDRVTGRSLSGLFAGQAAVSVPGAVLLLLSFPAAGMLFRGGRPFQALALLMMAGLVQAGEQAQGIMLAWILGGLFAGLTALLPRVAGWLAALFSAAAILALPYLAAQPGALQRLIPGGKSLSGAIADRWVLGHGFTAMEGPAGSGVLHIWFGLGIVGAAILCALVGMLAVAGSKGPPATRASKIGLLAAAFALSCVDPASWPGAGPGFWAAALFITGAFAAALPDRVRQR